MPRKVILILHDEDVRAMLRGALAGDSPAQYVQRAYREFRKKVQ